MCAAVYKEAKTTLSKSQRFDITMGLIEIVCFLVPWMGTGEIRYNIVRYMFESLKTGDYGKVYQKVFGIILPVTGNTLEIQRKIVWDAALFFLIACIVITIAIVLAAFYICSAMRRVPYKKIPKHITIVIITVCVMQGLEILHLCYSLYNVDWASTIPGTNLYLMVFVVLEGVWLICGNIVEEREKIFRQVEEERRKAELRRQEILESYIGNLERMIDETRAFQHDYKNILSTMAGFIRENQMDELREFFYHKIKLPEGTAGEQKEAWKYLKNVYPMELKGFLYEKILAILTRDIGIHVQSSEHIRAEYKDMEALIRILGVFIDNAVEEAERTEDGEVGLTITGTDKGVLFCVENNYMVRPKLSEMTKKGYSTKGEGRGMGLYLSQEILRDHTDMVHELRITDSRVIQQLEIILDE